VLQDEPTRNALLAALPREDLERWAPHLELIPMTLGQVLFESHDTIDDVYLPITAIVSLLYVTENGSTAEIAVVGREGLVGIAAFMGGETTPNRAVVQSAGTAYRFPARRLKAEFERSSLVLHLLLRFTQALIAQMSQTAVCNRHHSLHQQLCRWLLLSLDRLQGNELIMTQQLIADMLGVRRQGVMAEAARLQDASAIQYARGKIRVLDRQKLESLTCECYGVVKREYDRLFPPPTSD
jgi:CRP-like cAMP-binding protein